MKAVVYRRYGPPEVLEVQDIGTLAVPDVGVRVRVHAASVNPMDWYFLTGRPYLVRMITGLREPKRRVLGVDFAGTVESVGGKVQRLRPGDEVFGVGPGTLAEYVCSTEGRIALKPAGMTFTQAAAMPVAGLTALQGLRDKGKLQPGQKVLINGASGGVGTFAVQIAKALGAHVTGVCSTKHRDQARSIGADEVIDYTQEDFTRTGRRYALMFDIAGGRTWSDCRRVLEPKAALVVAGGPRSNRWTGPLGGLLRLKLATIGSSRRVATFIAKPSTQDLGALSALFEAGSVTPVIDRCYALEETPEAFRQLGEGHARGKIVVAVLAGGE